MKSSALLTFIGGVALGTVVALLMAPDDGKSTRKKIRRKMRDYGLDLDKDELSELIDKFRHKRTKKNLEEIVD